MAYGVFAPAVNAAANLPGGAPHPRPRWPERLPHPPRPARGLRCVRCAHPGESGRVWTCERVHPTAGKPAAPLFRRDSGTHSSAGKVRIAPPVPRPERAPWPRQFDETASDGAPGTLRVETRWILAWDLRVMDGMAAT